MMPKAVKKPATKLFTIGVRFSAIEKTALEKCAKVDERPISVEVRKIVADYLRAKGFLK
jgi:hypothetical protein